MSPISLRIYEFHLKGMAIKNDQNYLGLDNVQRGMLPLITVLNHIIEKNLKNAPLGDLAWSNVLTLEGN